MITKIYIVYKFDIYTQYNIIFVYKYITNCIEVIKMKLIGITGSIGCGKTTIAGLIRNLGYVVFDTDKWCRILYNQKDFLEVIKINFPQTFENGIFNKRKLRNHVFNNNKELKKLEKLIHPFLKKRLKNTIKNNSKNNDLLFIDVALLFEMGWNKYCSSIIVADVDRNIQKQRVMKRDNITSDDFDKIIKVQLDNEYKKILSDYVINTDKTLGLLKVELIELIERL